MEQPVETIPSLTDLIVYDPDELRHMTNEELLLQQIARQDLFFPKRQRNLDALAYRKQVVTEVTKYIEQLDAIPVKELQSQLKAITAAYLEGF